MKDAGELVVVVGGSGYLGLHLLQSLASHDYRLAFTYFSHSPSPALCAALPNARAFPVDLRSGDGFHSISHQMGPPRAVINCAAISNPRECELDPETARAINVPHALLSWLSSLAGTDHPLLIHLSTDQVYEGTNLFYKEEDEAKPVNTYGKSKLEAEQTIMKDWPNYAILRSSIIYGPKPIVQVKKSLPIQWIEGVLFDGKRLEFFNDEFRCPVFVKDVVMVVELLLRKQEKESTLQLLLNVGGPERLSRAEMAEVVAEVRGFDKSLITDISAASVNRGVTSPADISMNVNRCTSTLNISLTPFRKGVEMTLQPLS
ncbi:hypothetical protein GOP47_0026240 [Adiantum capillus-veneris]|nr:hypothetical protein GOP47_0026240 [Adiantum capillus-veneris]